MKIIKILLAVSLLVSWNNSWSVGTATSFHVSKVRIDKSGKGYVDFETPLVGTPAECGKNYIFSLAFDTNKPGGKGIYSMVLAAKMSNKKIIARGTGVCDIYSGVIESWDWGFIQ